MHNYKPTILVIDDEASVRRSLGIVLKNIGTIITAAGHAEAMEQLSGNAIDLVLLDIKLPTISGIEILKKIKKIDENMMVIMITAVRETKAAVEAMKLGAYDYITKPFDINELRILVKKALEKRTLIKENLFLQSEISAINKYDELVGDSDKMKQVFKMIDEAAASTGAVIIQGESGTGKELVARAIHYRSARGNRPFVVINCAGIPENLLESELFGHEAGAYTGAMERREGKFEAANGGSVFLDEICSMPLTLQAKMLRVLQEKKDGSKEIERVGSSKPISVDVRVISATNKDIKKSVAEGKFREDLYYRLNVLPINMPPLRERKDDIPLLADYFLEKYNSKLNKNIRGISEEAIKVMEEYAWPGNVRELKNIMERVVTMKQTGNVSIDDLPLEITISQSVLVKMRSGHDLSIVSAKGRIENQLIKKALMETRGNQIKASKLLGIHRNTLLAKLKQLGFKDEITRELE
jgi:DNA-binding NtrC family response regulator